MITAIDTTRIGTITSVTVTSSLSGTVYYHWYLDGSFIVTTTANTYTFNLKEGEQVILSVIDTTDADFDPIANAPDGWPSTRTLTWIRSLSDDVAKYRVEQSTDEESWTTLAEVLHVADAWEYAHVTDPLTDLETYYWRVVPVDEAGNDGTALTLGPERIVRTPNAPEFTVSFDSETDKITWAEAT